MNRQRWDGARTRHGRGRVLAAIAAGALGAGAAGPAVLAGEAEPNSASAVAEAEPTSAPAAVEVEPTGPLTAADAMIANVAEIAEAAGVDPGTVLAQAITTQLPDGNGGVREVTAPIGAVLDLLGGGLILDDAGGDTESDDDGRETAGPEPATAPHLAAGGILHVAATASVEVFLPSVHVDDLSPDPAMHPYDVVESEYVPSTPLVPGVNPLFLAAGLAGVELPAELTEAAPGLDDPVLLLHPGGRLTSIQGGDWNVLGVHGAGSYGVGHNLDTGPREVAADDVGAEASDPWPVWVPFVTGATAVPDTAIDFAGFGIVVNTSSCTLVRVSSNPASSFYNRIVSRICVGVGAIIGDGVAFFDGSGPVDLRADLQPLWDPAPEELAPVMEIADEISAQVDELTGTLLDAVDLGDLTDPLGDDAPPAPDGDDGDDAGDGVGPPPGAGTLVDQVLGLLP